MTAVQPSQIKAIHTLRGQAGLSEVDYREHLKARFRVFSSKQLSEAQAHVLLDDLRALSGRKGESSGGRSGVRQPLPQSKRASGKYAPILQALWIAAYNLAIVDNADDAALLGFVKRQCKLDHDRWLTDHTEAAKVIEALKSWLCREGGIAAFATPKQAREMGVDLKTLNKRIVLEAIARRLVGSGLDGFELETWLCLDGLPRLAACSDAQLDKAAARMGAMLRGRMGK